MSKFYIKLLIVLIFTATTLQPVIAVVEQGSGKGVSALEESVEQLVIIRDDTSLSDKEKAIKELELRKKILTDVLNLSLGEVDNLKTKITSLPKFKEGSREAVLKGEYIKALDNYLAYYKGQLEKLSGLNNLEAAKQLAQEVKDYRDSIYNPEIKNIFTFVLVFYGEDVISVANTRLDKITSDIKQLEKLGYIKPGSFSTQLNDASTLLKEAKALQSQAKELILAVPDEEQELTPEEQVMTEETVEEPAPDAGELITASLQKVKAAYNIFLQIGKDIRKILGIE